MKKSSLFLLTLGFCFSFGGAAFAVEGKGPCREDLKKYCADVTPGKGRIMECLHAHRDKLSDECRAELRERHKEMSEKHRDMVKEMHPGKGKE